MMSMIRVDDYILEVATKQYDQESEYSKHLDEKASNQVGFVGIILAIFASFFGFTDIDVIRDGIDFNFLFWGIGILLIAILFGIFVLTPFFKSRAYFDLPLFYKNFRGKEDKQKETMIKVYFELTRDMLKRNNQKAIILYIGNAFTFGGLVISFISLIPLLEVITK